MSLKKKVFKWLSLVLGPPLFRLLTRMLFATCRVDWVGEERFVRFKRENRPFVGAFWHYGLFYIMQLKGKTGKMVAMVSASQDGEYVARFLEGLGVETVRGSRNRRGVGALKEMIRAVRDRGSNAAIVADGSQGPPLLAQPGAVLLAERTNTPILPMGWAAQRYWAFRSWDRTILPKPFSRIAMEVGEPLDVPRGLTNEGVEEYRLELERRLLGIYRRCWGKFGRQTH